MAKKKKGEWIKLDPPERQRTYGFRDGETLVLTEVSRMKVSESGNHYLDAANGKYIVAPTWNYIKLDMDNWTF